MSVQPLCTEPHEILRAPAEPVGTVTGAVRALAADLIDTMYANDGIGLAAPQIGRLLQVCVANPSRQHGQEVVVVNPRVEAVRGRVRVTEGCLSLPNVWGKVRRAARVRLSGQDVSGRPMSFEAEGLLAVVLQHECDHLQGRMFIDRLPWYRRRRFRARLAGAA